MTPGFGRLPRKEDQRFVRGMGTYVDDVYLPGMLYGAVLRSPHPHARIVSIDTVAAEAHPKVKAVITGEMLQGRNLAWMPTLSGDRQAVLATDKVRFQGQEVAFVVAEDHYSARDALELIDVEYEPLPAVADARRALEDGTPVIRDDRAGQADNHIFDWETGDADRTENLVSTGFARDYVMRGEIAATKEGKILAIRTNVLADHDVVAGEAGAGQVFAAVFHPLDRLAEEQ